MTLAFSRGRSITDNRPEQRKARDFPSFIAALDADRAATKADAAYICAAMSGRRSADNVRPAPWLAVDADRVDVDVLADFRMWFMGWSGCAWPTHSSTPSKPRERVVLELARPATRAESIATGAALTSKLAAEFGSAVQVDPCCFRPEQPVFVPPVGVLLARFEGEPFPVESVAPTEEAQRNSEVILSSSVGSLSSSVGIPPDTLPADVRQRNACLFQLARHVKRQKPNATRDELRTIAARWHELALPVIETKEFSVTFADFVRGYEKVQQPFGAIMDSVLEHVDERPLPAGVAALRYGDAGNRLVRICAALQSHHGAEPFFLSSRQAGELIDMHFTDAAKMLSALVGDGVLELVSRGAGRVASRYRFCWKTA